MKWLWKREWAYDKKDILIQLAVSCLLSAALFLFFKWKGIWLEQLFDLMFRMPKALYVLWGVSEKPKASDVWYYIMFLSMFLNVWIIWKNGVRMRRILLRDERNQNIYLLCGQACSRRQIIVEKYLLGLAEAVFSYLAWILALLILAFLAGGEKAEQMARAGTAGRFLAVGTCVNILLVSAVCLYIVCRKRKQHSYMSEGVDLFVFGTLAAGNLHKICGLLELLLTKLKKGENIIEKLEGLSKGLEKLYWLSPLSWLNPYRMPGKAEIGIQAGICLVVSAVLAVLAVRFYEKRRL